MATLFDLDSFQLTGHSVPLAPLPGGFALSTPTRISRVRMVSATAAPRCPKAIKRAQARQHPDDRGGRHPENPAFPGEDDPRSQEADSSHDLPENSSWIGPFGIERGAQRHGTWWCRG